MRKLLLTGPALLLAGFAFSQTYQHYYGTLHSHSGYSDGNKDSSTSGAARPSHDYAYAKASYHMDFLGISEHNHYQAGMKTPEYYRSGIAEATAANQNGTFVALYGMEWGVISGGGHVLVYGIDSLVGWDKQADGVSNNYDIFCAKNDYTSLWNIVAARSKAFCTLAHPNSSDFGNLLGTAFSNVADHVIVGTAYRSGSAFTTTTNYTDAPASSDEGYYRSLLAKGYHAAPQIDADSHNTTFGRNNQGRTVVLASSLHRDSILAALRSRRYYASDDWNAEVDFTVEGQFMGSVGTTHGNPQINVTVTDVDGEGVSSIQIFFGVPGSGVQSTVLTSRTNSNTLSFTHTINIGSSFYYYAKVTQADGGIIITAPVWITRVATLLPVAGLQFSGKVAGHEAVLQWQTEQEHNNSHFVIERSVDGYRFEAIGQVSSRDGNARSPQQYRFVDATAFDGLQFYRLRQVDRNGGATLSSIIQLRLHKPGLDVLTAFPNPATDLLHLHLKANQAGSYQYRVYTIDGQEVYRGGWYLQRGFIRTSIPVQKLAFGTYMLVLFYEGKRVAEMKWVKGK